MSFEIIYGLAAIVAMCLAMWQSDNLHNEQRRNADAKDAMTVLLNKLKNEREAHRSAYRDLCETKDQLVSVSAAQRAGSVRLHEAAEILESMTSQRDELLAQVIFDGTELETVFEDIEDAENFLAKRKRAMQGLRRVLKTVDFDDPAWGDDHVSGKWDKDQNMGIDHESYDAEETFPHCSAADTIQARDELMLGFDKDKESKS